jgi:hypothetical protein
MKEQTIDLKEGGFPNGLFKNGEIGIDPEIP